MELQNGLNVATLIMCLVTLTMASAALVPQIKQGLVMLRDGLLWAILLGIIGMVGFIGWGRLQDMRQRRVEGVNSTSYETQVEPLAVTAPDTFVNSSVYAKESWLSQRDRNPSLVNGVVDRRLQ